MIQFLQFTRPDFSTFICLNRITGMNDPPQNKKFRELHLTIFVINL